ncbi:MAG: glycogen/starch/alpha-glucan phosphorylase [Nitrospiraceae bacterium]|nr:glycogen/starch/alpha-glucan phosphorylase [Nitrospiraceae bacterium]
MPNNPLRYSMLISRKIGTDWIRDLEELRRLEEFADDEGFREEWCRVKLDNKDRLASHIQKVAGIEVDPNTLFDMQVKRIHEYKRQHLNVLHIIALYVRIKAVADVINSDPDVRGRLKVVFFPDFNVKNGQKIYPAAELSEQISTAGKEASGTGNMKFALNGALTIGTLDGANVEIREEVGAENFYLFGLTAAQVEKAISSGYSPSAIYASNQLLREVIELIRGGHFSPKEPALFRPLVDTLMDHDEYLLFADFQSYIDCQDEVGKAYRDKGRWTRMSILNTARMGKFSSDRAIREYCDDIWKAKPVKVDMTGTVEWSLKKRGTGEPNPWAERGL